MARDDRPAKRRGRPGTEDWRLKAACRPLDSALFFPDRTAAYGNSVAYAKAVCRECPVRQACLQAAIDGREKIGIWGGLTPEERARLHRRDRGARDNAATAETRLAARVVDATRAGRVPPATRGRPVAGMPSATRLGDQAVAVYRPAPSDAYSGK